MNFMSTRSRLALICFCHLLWIGALFWTQLPVWISKYNFGLLTLFGLWVLIFSRCGLFISKTDAYIDFIYLLCVGCTSAPFYFAGFVYHGIKHGFFGYQGAVLFLIEVLLITDPLFVVTSKDKNKYALQGLVCAVLITLVFIVCFSYFPHGLI